MTARAVRARSGSVRWRVICRHCRLNASVGSREQAELSALSHNQHFHQVGDAA